MADCGTHVTYCRICPAHCGLEVELAGGAVTRVIGDKAHPLTHGFTCAKGRRIGDFHAERHRLLESQRQRPDGTFEPLAVQSAIEEIAHRLSSIIEAHGPDSVGLFVGTQTYMASLTYSFMSAWFRAVGSRNPFESSIPSHERCRVTPRRGHDDGIGHGQTVLERGIRRLERETLASIGTTVVARSAEDGEVRMLNEEPRRELRMKAGRAAQHCPNHVIPIGDP